MDRDSTSRRKFAANLNIERIHQFNKIIHNNIDAIFMEWAMISKAKEIEF